MSEQDPNPANSSQPKKPRLIIPGREAAAPAPAQPSPVQPAPEQPLPQQPAQPAPATSEIPAAPPVAATPEPAPVVQSQPAPVSHVEPAAPAPAAEAAPAPVAQPEPAPQLAPEPVATPAETPAPPADPTPPAAPAPEPIPAHAVEPAPAPLAQPAPAPAPQATPAPAPVVQPAPQVAPAPQAAPAQPPAAQIPQVAPAPQMAPAQPAAPVPVQPATPQPAPAAGVSPQVTVHLAGTPVQPQAPAPAAPVANPLLSATPQATATTPPAGMTPGLGTPGQPPLGGSSVTTLAPKPRKGVSTPVKAMIAVTLLAGIIMTAVVIKGNSDRNARVERLNEIAAYFKNPDDIPEEIPMSGDDVDLILGAMVSTEKKSENEREFYLRALNIGKATDGTDIGTKVATFAKDREMESALRAKLFRVVGRRGEQGALPALIAFVSETDNSEAGQAALEAAKEMADISNFQSLLAIITNSPNAEIKNSAVKLLSKVITDSEDPSGYARPIISSFRTVADDDSKSALLRLMGSAGGDEAADLVADNLESDKSTMKIAAIYALRYWPDDSQLETFFDFARTQGDDRIRNEAFSNLVDFLTDNADFDKDDLYSYWSEIAVIATGETEQRRVVSAMGKQNDPWADDVLDYFVVKADSDKVEAMAEDIKERLAENIKRAQRTERLKNRGNSDDE